MIIILNLFPEHFVKITNFILSWKPNDFHEIYYYKFQMIFMKYIFIVKYKTILNIILELFPEHFAKITKFTILKKYYIMKSKWFPWNNILYNKIQNHFDYNIKFISRTLCKK